MPDQNQLFKSNLAALEAFDPAFTLKLLHFQSYSPHTIKADLGREVSLLVDGLQLTSHHDQEWALRQRLTFLDLKAPVHLYGIGLGFEIRALLAYQSVPEIIVHVLCPVLLLQLMSMDDEFTSILSSRITLRLDDDDDHIFHNHLINLTELKLEVDFANALKLRLQSALDESYAKKLFERTVGIRIDQKILAQKNELLAEKFLKLDELPQKPQVVVIASGPSLESEFNELQKLQKAGWYTIAVDTALIYLETQHFVPDAVVSIDDLASLQSGKLFFKDRSLYSNTLLLFSPSSDLGLWKGHPGMRRCLINERALKLIPELTSKHGDELYSSGSVTLTAVALGLALKARKMAFIGMDFAYLGTQVHAGIAGDKDFLTDAKGELHVRCNDGKIRTTQRNFTVYRLDLEDLIALNRQTQFINLSKKGAVIRGTQKL